MVSGLRAGHSLIAAVGLVARECSDPIGCEFKTCFDEQNYGLELKTALENMITRVPLQDLRIVSSAIMIQKESGGNLAEVLDKASHAIRERFRLKRQISVHTAQGRLTGLDSRLSAGVSGRCDLLRQPRHDEYFMETPHRHQAAVRIRRHDDIGWVDHSQDCQHGRVKVEPWNLRLLLLSECSCSSRLAGSCCSIATPWSIASPAPSTPLLPKAER